MPRARIAAIGAFLLLAVSVGRAENWPAWRGPTGQGYSNDKNLPTKWSATENVKWKIPLPDDGNSTPVVWGEKIFLTQATEMGKKRSLWCLSRKDGSKLWEKTVAYGGDEPKHQTNTFCASSPVTDGERVVVWHGSAGLYCYDLNSTELWNRNLGTCIHMWGNASSPVIYKDHVILNFGPGERTFLIAINKKNGTDAWKIEERVGTVREYVGSWSTPVVAEVKGRTELLVSWPAVVKSYEPQTGNLIWSSRGLEKEGGADRLTYASPLVANDVVVAMAGFNGSAIGVKAGGTGDVTDSHRLWRVTKGNPQRVGSGVIVGDHVYSAEENGVACIELKTGKEVWKQPVPGRTWSSLVHADGKLFVVGEQGETFVLAAKPELELIARNQLDGAITRASLVPSEGELLIRTYKHLWCIAEKK
jgi:outer membrane protein assembly factor BamB